MADVTAFDVWPGEASGRVVDALGRATQVLGSLAHAVERVADGDHDEAAQQASFEAAVRLVRVRLDVAAGAPDDASWSAVLRRDGESRVVLPVWRKPWTRRLSDVAVPVAPGTARADLGVRLVASVPGGEAWAALPAVSVHELVEVEEADLARPCLINRSPEPGEPGVPRDALVVVEVHDHGGALGDLLAGAFTVRVADHLAWSDAAGFAPGWDGPGSQVEVLDDLHTWRVTVDRVAPYASLQRVAVEVLFVGLSPETSLSQAYEFQVEDATAPRLLQVDAVSHGVFRARFSEPVEQGGGGADDALVAANWSVTLASTSLDDGLPALQVSCASVRPVAGSAAQVDLVLDREATAGARYLVVVSGVEDLFGNVVDPDHDSAVVVGYACPPAEGRRFDLSKWVPEMNVALDHPRRGGTRDLEVLLKVWQHVVDRVLCDVDRFPELFDPDRAPEPFVDAMLADYGVSPYGGPRQVPFARFGLDLAQKRRLLRAVLALYKQKGTSDGIAAAARLFLGVEVYTSTPALAGVWVLGQSPLGVGTKLGTDDLALLYSFYVLSPTDLTDEQRYWVREFALYARPAHCHFLGILDSYGLVDGAFWILGGSELGTTTRLGAP